MEPATFYLERKKKDPSNVRDELGFINKMARIMQKQHQGINKNSILYIPAKSPYYSLRYLHFHSNHTLQVKSVLEGFG
jgi:hypothetical protein